MLDYGVGRLIPRAILQIENRLSFSFSGRKENNGMEEEEEEGKTFHFFFLFSTAEEARKSF